jgi:hypothetical protein
MAREVQYIVRDDMDASTGDVGTYRFALEGVDFEIDLSDANCDKLRAALQPFIAVARRQRRNGKAAPRRGPGTKDGRALSAQLRDWWQEHWQALGLPEPRTHGAIPTQVRDAYTAHSSTAS